MSTPQTYTKIKIISLSLINVGKGPVNSIAGAGEFAEAASDVYDLLFPSLITAGDWRFAVKTEELSRNVIDPEIQEWDYSWELPADFLAMIRLSPAITYNIYGSNIYTKTTATSSSSSTRLRAIYYFQPLAERLPPYFVRFLVYQLSADFAWGIARDKNLAEVYEKKARHALIEGQAIDAKNHPNIAVVSAPYVTVRNTTARRAYVGWQ